LSFPAWNPYFPYTAGDKVTYFYKIAKLCSVIVVPSEAYAIDLKKHIKNHVIEVITTGYDDTTFKASADKYKKLITHITSREFTKEKIAIIKTEALKISSKPLKRTPLIVPEFKHFESGDKVKIGFLPHKALDDGPIAAGTRIRVVNIAKYLDNCIISEQFKELKHSNVVIFQARWKKGDEIIAKRLRNEGVKLIFDTTDPHWDTENFDTTGIKMAEINKILPYMNVIILPTEELKKSFLKFKPGMRVELIADSVDMEVHNKLKLHKEQTQYKILWFGCRSNVSQIETVRKDLEKLGEEFNIKLIAVYDKNYGVNIESFNNLGLEVRDWTDETVIEALTECDISINPRYYDWRKYKSYNKSNKSLAMGVPCVENNIYENGKELLSSATLRNKVGKNGRNKIEKYLDTKNIAKDLENLCTDLATNTKIGKTRSKNKIAVVTCITGGWDNIHAPVKNEDNIDYHAFVDTNIQSKVWQMHHIDYSHFKQPRLTSKIYKMIPHKIEELQDYDYLVWIDGAVSIKSSITALIDKYLEESDMALFKHRIRSCAYKEMEISTLNGYHATGEPVSIRQKQIYRFVNDGFPNDFGLFECTIIMRKNSNKVKKFNNEWWSEVTTNTASDQAAFMYTSWKNPSVKIATIKPGDARNSKWFKHIEHEGRKI